MIKTRNSLSKVMMTTIITTIIMVTTTMMTTTKIINTRKWDQGNANTNSTSKINILKFLFEEVLKMSAKFSSKLRHCDRMTIATTAIAGD